MKFNHSSAYSKDAARRHLPEALAEGTERMRKEALAGNYMWPRPGEQRSYYSSGDHREGSARGTIFEMRVKESTLRNVWHDSVLKQAHGPFRDPIIIEGFSTVAEEWCKNLDGSGRDYGKWLLEVAEGAGVSGIHLGLVDLPRVLNKEGAPVERSLGDDDRAGVRPFAISIPAAHFDPLVIEKRAGSVVLRLGAVFLSSSQRTYDSKDTLGKEKTKAVWRLYKLVEEGDEGGMAAGVYTFDYPLKSAEPEADIDKDALAQSTWIPIIPQGSGILSRIPIIPFYGDFWLPYRGRPRFKEAAEVQASAWRKRSHKDDLARRTARMRTFQNGVDVDKDGHPKFQHSGDLLFSSRPEADAKILETSGAALKALDEDLRGDEEYIRESCRAMSARRTTGLVTATEVGLQGVESGSHQKAVVSGFAQSLGELLTTMEEIAGLPPSKGSVEWLYKGFAEVGQETLSRAREGVADGTFSIEGLLLLEKASGGLPESFSIAEELQRIKASSRIPDSQQG